MGKGWRGRGPRLFFGSRAPRLFFGSRAPRPFFGSRAHFSAAAPIFRLPRCRAYFSNSQARPGRRPVEDAQWKTSDERRLGHELNAKISSAGEHITDGFVDAALIVYGRILADDG